MGYASFSGGTPIFMTIFSKSSREIAALFRALVR